LGLAKTGFNAVTIRVGAIDGGRFALPNLISAAGTFLSSGG
jgi:hypothetical protein